MQIDERVEEAAAESYAAGETIKEASQTKFRTYKWKIGAAIGAAGAAIGAFFGGLLGAGVGGTGGTAVGAGVGKSIEKSGLKGIENIEFQRPGGAAQNPP